MTATHEIVLTVPDTSAASRWLASVAGSPQGEMFWFEPGVRVALRAADTGGPADPPRIVDLGTNHLCFRVDDIERTAEHLAALPETTVLGDIITVPDGPIAGNRWIYFRSPWGTLFELQQWPEVPAYAVDDAPRLFHGHSRTPAGAAPGVIGLDHSGYSVHDLDDLVDHLVGVGGQVVLRTEIQADAGFMQAQFGVDTSGTSRMAMVALDGLNLELFEHGVPDVAPPRPVTQLGGHRLVLRSGTAIPARFALSGAFEAVS